MTTKQTQTNLAPGQRAAHVACYVRIADDDPEVMIDRKRRLREAAKRRSLWIDSWHIDRQLLAGDPRPALADLILACRDGTVGCVFLDELVHFTTAGTDRIQVLLDIMRDLGVRVVCLRPKLDSSEMLYDVAVQVLTYLATAESEIRKERGRVYRRVLEKEGRAHVPPKLTWENGHAERIRQLVAAGKCRTEIAKELWVTRPNGGRAHPSRRTLCYEIKRLRAAGELIPKGQTGGDPDWYMRRHPWFTKEAGQIPVPELLKSYWRGLGLSVHRLAYQYRYDEKYRWDADQFETFLRSRYDLRPATYREPSDLMREEEVQMLLEKKDAVSFKRAKEKREKRDALVAVQEERELLPEEISDLLS